MRMSSWVCLGAALACGPLRAEDAPKPEPKPAQAPAEPKPESRLDSKSEAPASPAAPAAAPDGAAKSDSPLKTVRDKASYGLGFTLGRNIKTQGADLDADLIARGIRDAFAAAKPLAPDEELNQALTAYQKEIMARQAERMKQLGEKNKTDGEAFLATNKTKEGVTTLPSGLQYKVLKPGSGRKPALNDTITAHYRGTLLDGAEFDSSYSRGKPASFPVRGVIPGWTEALQLMEVGAKWQLFVPANLAYGEQSRGQITPNSTLLFEIELISIQEPSGKLGK